MPAKGYKQTLEHKQRIRETWKKLVADGKMKNWNQGLPKEMQPRFGKKFPHSEGTKQKISNANKGQIPWNKGKKATQISKAKMGHITSEETKQKLRLANLGKKMSEEAKRKISLANLRNPNRYWLGKTHTEETRQKMMTSHKGKKLTEEHKRKIGLSVSKAMKGFHPKTQFKKGNIPWSKGKKGFLKHSIETKRKISEANKGKKLTETTKQKLRLANLGNKNSFYGKHHSEENLQKMRLANLGKKLTREHIRNALRRREKSSLEIKFEKICLENNLPYKFVGNGEFFIERKNPDFINVNGEKIAIEVYYRKHKELFGQAKNIGIEQWKKERSEIFAKYGWKVIYFDETEVTKELILKTLSRGE